MQSCREESANHFAFFVLFYYYYYYYYHYYYYFANDRKILVTIRFCFVFRDPNGPDSPVTWPKFTKVNRSYLALDVKPKGKQKYRAKELEFWNSLIPKVIRQTKGQKGKLCSGAAKQPVSIRRL